MCVMDSVVDQHLSSRGSETCCVYRRGSVLRPADLPGGGLRPADLQEGV